MKKYICMHWCLIQIHTWSSSNMLTGSFSTSWYFNLQWCHFHMAPPPAASKLSNEICTREREARHSKTLADFAELDNMGPPQTWTCLAAGTVGAILMDARWAETCPQSTHSGIATTAHALTLSTLALFEFDWRKNNQLRIRVKCQTAYLCLNE